MYNFNNNGGKMTTIIETIHINKNGNNVTANHNLKDIDYVMIQKSINQIFIQYKNGNSCGSKISNFKKRRF